MKPQATKATQAQVRLHIARQRVLGQNAIPGSDKPSKWDVISIVFMAGLICFGTFKGWW